mmetsp:Transcript_59697/g.139039  ORF Transcript_59697/g.139039 Transcript_59697/m.139039 type:complete len:98 (-) Transcript_59697:207-500(-)
MAQRSSSRLMALALCLCGCLLLASVPAFLSTPSTTAKQPPARAAALAVAAAAAPQAALATGYFDDMVQFTFLFCVGGFGPAVLFWIYQKSEESKEAA